MVCIYCHGDTKVINSRLQIKRNNVWRRRKCLECGAITSTTEAVDLARSISVRRKMKIEPFERDKLMLSVYNSLRHRKSALGDSTAITETVIAGLLKTQITHAVIDSEHIKELAIKSLSNFDKAAATSYQAFHS